MAGALNLAQFAALAGQEAVRGLASWALVSASRTDCPACSCHCFLAGAAPTEQASVWGFGATWLFSAVLVGAALGVAATSYVRQAGPVKRKALSWSPSRG